MALGNLGSGGKPKSSLFGAPAPAAAPKPAPAPAAAPKPAPAPTPAPAPKPAPAPAADSEAAMGFKQRMDAFEKKLGEQLKSIVPPAPIIYPPPPPRTGEIEVLNKKIDEMERHLSDFSQAAASSAAQLKSIGESAHREFSDLFKLVREHQKYSELDRQMHGQLERAWVRSEELEKKLMDFYSSVLTLETKRREDADRASDKTAAAIELLARRLEDFEKSVSESSPAGELRAAQEKFFVRAQEEAQRQAAAQEAFRAELAASVDRLVLSTPAGELRAAQEEFFARAREEERRQAAAREASRVELAAGLKESSQVFKDIFENYVRTELEQLRREMAAAGDESRKFLREQSAFASGKAEKFEEIARANVLKAEGVDGALAAAARSQAAALDEFSRRLRSEISAMNAEFSASVRAESDARFEKFGAKYADALRSVTFVENFSAALSESLDKFENYGGQLETFLKEVSPAQLEKASGVSGMLVRRQLGAMSGMLETLKAEAARLREIKRGVEEKFAGIFKER